MGLGEGRTPKKRKEELLRNAVILFMPKRGEQKSYLLPIIPTRPQQSGQ
jgi:hypothetical protein